MPLHMLATPPISEPSVIGTFRDCFLYDFLPAFAVWAGLMAVIWIACAAIALSGFYIGGVSVIGVRELIHGCARYIRRRRFAEDAPPDSVDSEAAHNMLVHIDHDRRPDWAEHDDTHRHPSDDDSV